MQYYESIAVGATARPTDVVLFLSYSGNLADNLAEEMRILKHVGCKVILITSDTALHNTDVTIQFPRRENDGTWRGLDCIRCGQAAFRRSDCRILMPSAKDFLEKVMA